MHERASESPILLRSYFTSPFSINNATLENYLRITTPYGSIMILSFASLFDNMS